MSSMQGLPPDFSSLQRHTATPITHRPLMAAATPPASAALAVSPLIAQLDATGWSRLEFLSDLHLHAGAHGAATARAFADYLQATQADAIFLLGDVFEVWVGDDAAEPGGFEAEVAAQLKAASVRAQLFFMAGNRDFLLGDAYLAQAGMQALADPCCLDLGETRWLLTHGDAWCLDDLDYQRFRQQVRTPAWQAALLAKPLAERQAIGRAMREASASKQASMVTHADVDHATALAAMQACGASVLLHGHTHRPAEHHMHGEGPGGDVPTGLRVVLSDWDLAAQPPRAEYLRLQRDAGGHWQWQRMPMV